MTLFKKCLAITVIQVCAADTDLSSLLQTSAQVWSLSAHDPLHNASVRQPLASLKPVANGTRSMSLWADVRRNIGSRNTGTLTLSWICMAMIMVVCATFMLQAPQVRAWLLERRSEDTPTPQASTRAATIAAVSTVVVCGAAYIACSVVLIKYNKYLISDGRFPFAANLTLGHQVCGSVFLLAFFLVKRDWYPSLVEPEKRATCFSFRFLRMGALPIAICFSVQLVLSNFAYLYASVAFLQMMKEGNMVLVYCLSLVAGLEAFQSVQARVLLCLLFSTVLTIQGELAFSIKALCVQGSSQVVEATKIVVQSTLLSAAGSAKLDPLSYNLLIQPLSAFCIIIFILVSTFSTNFPTASWTDYAAWWPHLLCNACVALSLNVMVAVFISKTSAVGFIIVGIVKDTVLVVVDVLISGTHLSKIQIVGFVLQIMFVGSYSFLKTIPKK
mmetsp:Transcript_55647/g.129555  ORF Transcript_55647/g.129555 Transcript_55647/m.129555 type:complete len:443 (-) Transcript_55647:119-1447(-)